jgi:hypothetical protein
LKRLPTEPSPTWACTATTRRSKSWKSPRPDCSDGYAAKLACELASVPADHDPSARVEPVLAKSDLERPDHETNGHEHREVKPNLDESAKRVALVAQAKAP